MAQTLEALGASADRILLISASGANAQLFYGSVPAEAAPICLAVGRFVAKKGPLHTIRAFSAQPYGQLWMVGEGPLLAEAKELVKQLKLGHRIRFLGVCSQAEVAALMRQVRLFVQHSLVAADGDSEGNPVAVMEAQLSGLPVVATRHAGIPEVVSDGQTGLLVEEGDVRGMAAAMERLLQDPVLCTRLGAAGRRHVEQGFTLERHLADLSRFLIQTHEKYCEGRMSGMNQRLLQCLAHAMGGDIVWIDSDLLVAPGMPKACPVASAGSAYGFARQRFGLKRDCYERIVWACRSVRFSAQLRLASLFQHPRGC